MTEARTLRRVLVAEDDPDIRGVLWLALERLGGLEVHLCAGGAEVLESLRVVEPDLVILDVMMPGMSGPTVAAAIRSLDREPEVPIVFLTARAREEEVQHLLTVGALAVIRKPFDPLTLADRIRELWAEVQEQPTGRSAG